MRTACLALLSTSCFALRLPTPASRTTAVSTSTSVKAIATGRRSVLLGVGAAVLAPPLRSVSAAEPTIYTPPAGSLTGTTVLITGANTGLGLESAKRLAVAGATLIVTARSKAKADGAVKDVLAAVPGSRVTGVDLDLANLASVKGFPERLTAAAGDVPIDVLLNNAGVMAIPERVPTLDGFEKTIGVNHLGHYALVGVLLPLLKKAKNVSNAHNRTCWLSLVLVGFSFGGTHPWLWLAAAAVTAIRRTTMAAVAAVTTSHLMLFAGLPHRQRLIGRAPFRNGRLDEGGHRRQPRPELLDVGQLCARK